PIDATVAASMKPLKVEEQFVRSFDGTGLACHSAGRGRPVLLANGLGGSWKAWTHQIQYFLDRYRFVSWDYRGLYRSRAPSDREALQVDVHARDAVAVLDALGIEQTSIFGWSMGVQVGLEIFRQAPDRVKALVLINGVAGAPWESVFNLPAAGKVVPHVIDLLVRMPGLTHQVTERVVQWPETIGWAKRLGLAGRTLDEEIFAQLAGSFAGLDMELYMRMLGQLGEHDARDVLEEVDVPVLVVAGDRDLFTPKGAAQEMAKRIRGAELLVVPGGTHYVAVEYPELVNLRVEKFFHERGYAPEPA
ncbi:MAG: alpha/beta hydrolase, partial [Sandaracinaceae bacterium]|nr:alpha/beta hydrolase [Sandaracinaceae bacterium]